MKKVVSVLLLLFILICGYKKESHHPAVIKLPIQDWKDGWILTDSEAAQMISYYDCSSSRCKNHKKFTVNDTVMGEIFDNYNVTDTGWVNARYRASDVARYKKARHINDGEARGKVSGYSTKILVVTVEDGATGKGPNANTYTTKLYFDVGTICPPPSSCQ